MRSSVAFIFALVIATSALVSTGPANAQDLVSNDEISRSVVIRQVKETDGTVSGVLINKTLMPLTEVRLLIRHTFFWKKERSPSDESENPARAVFFDVPGTIPPAGVVAFTYKPDPPLPERKDGRFKTSIEVVGFAESGQ